MTVKWFTYFSSATSAACHVNVDLLAEIAANSVPLVNPCLFVYSVLWWGFAG